MTIQEYNDIYKNSITKSMQIESSGGVTITNTNICSEQMSLEEALCSEENLIIGSCESACFKIRIADMNHNFEGETLTVYQMIMVDAGGDLLLESGDSDYILLENGDRISLEMVGVPVPYGKFKVLSDKPTNDRRWRDLTCYDAMYDILNADVAEWYNSLTFPMTIKNFRDRFFNYLGITQDTVTLVNDNFETQGGFSVSGSLSGKDVITSICELNGVFGHISRDGLFEYISLPSADSLALDWYIDGTGAYEDYIVQKITGIVARSSEDDVGTTVGTDTNLYVVEDNPLIYGSEGTASLTTALTNLLNNVKDINYRPFNVDTYGNPMLPLGTNLTITTRNQTINSFLMTRVLSGIQSLKDSISAKGEKYRPTEVNSLRSETKRTKGIIHELINDVDELRSTITDLDNQTSSEIQQLSDEIVLKVDASGNIVKVALASNVSEGSTFAVNADNIRFTAGSVMRFDANNIVINSTYFKVDQYGNLECTSGKIGGWTISSNSLKKTYSNLSNTVEYETALVASNNSSKIYSQMSYTSAGFKVKLNIEDGLLDIINTAGSSMDANTPIVSFGYTLAGTSSTPTSAAGIIHVYDTKYINGDDSIPYTVTTNYGFEVRKNGTGFASINDNGVCLYYLGNNYGKVLAVDNTSDHKIVATNTSITEVEYVHGVTSNIQTQLNGKQATITGGATTIVSDNLTASKVLVSNANGKVAVSNVTDTELGYLSGATSNIQGQIDGLGAKAVSGNPVFITDAEAMNADEVIATITPTQTGSGTPSPSNVRPFTGFSNVDVAVFGENLVSLSDFVADNTTITVENDEIKIVADGTKQYACANVGTTITLPFKAGTYYVSFEVEEVYNTTFCLFSFRNSNWGIVESVQINNVGKYGAFLTMNTDCFLSVILNDSYTYNRLTMSNINVVKVNNQYTVQLGDTYYGATLDVTSGKLTATWKNVDLSTLTWAADTRTRWVSNGIPNILPCGNGSVSTAKCDSFVFVTSDYLYNDSSYIGIAQDNANRLQVRNGSTTDKPTGQVVYPLATPIEIQLTPQQIALLENNNTITTNVSSLDITYQTNNGIGDTASALDKRVASLESTQNYSLSEQKTGKYWIDGKPIYQKTFNLTLTEGPSSAHMFEKNVDVTDLNIDMMISIDGVWRRTLSSGWSAYYQLGGNESGYGDSCGRLSSDKKTITLLFKTEGTNSQIFTIKYTKAS